MDTLGRQQASIGLEGQRDGNIASRISGGAKAHYRDRMLRGEESPPAKKRPNVRTHAVNRGTAGIKPGPRPLIAALIRKRGELTGQIEHVTNYKETMMTDKTIETDPGKERAKAYARRVIEKDFGQSIDDDTLNSVAEKILKVIPKDDRPQQARPVRRRDERKIVHRR